MATKTRLRHQLTNEARYCMATLEFDPQDPEAKIVEPRPSEAYPVEADPAQRTAHQHASPNTDDEVDENDGDDSEFPIPLSESVKILGIQFDKHMTLDDHFRDLLRRSQIRQAVLARVANQTWGLDNTI